MPVFVREFEHNILLHLKEIRKKRGMKMRKRKDMEEKRKEVEKE